MEGPPLPLQEEPKPIEVKEKKESITLKYISDIEEHYEDLLDDLDGELVEIKEEELPEIASWDKEKEDVRFRLDDATIAADKLFSLYHQKVRFYEKEIEHLKSCIHAIKKAIRDKYTLNEEVGKIKREIKREFFEKWKKFNEALDVIKTKMRIKKEINLDEIQKLVEGEIERYTE